MICTIGYEKADLEHFVGTLQAAEIDILVDIRDRAQSRRKGFSKTALDERLNDADIGYIHFRELGDPKEGREAARSGDMVKFRSIFDSVLASEPAQHALDQVADLAKSKRICLMCYERDHKECHRNIVSDALEEKLGVRTKHLGVQAIEPIRKTERPLLRRHQGAAA